MRVRFRFLASCTAFALTIPLAGMLGGATASAATSAALPAHASNRVKPKGDPVVIAMISQERGAATVPEARRAAQAAVKYVNAELGGAGGRPFQLETCITDGSPEQSSACANQLLEKHPVAFVAESELGTSGSVPIIEKANVPLVGAAGVTPELVFSKDAFAFGLDAVADWAGWTKYLTTDGKVKTINLVNLDIPAASVFEAVVRSVALANGAKVGKVVSLPLDATDAAPQVAAAAEGSPDMIMGVTSAQLCVPVAQAHQSVASGTKLFLPGSCGNPQLIKAAGSAIDGAYIGSGSLNPYDVSQPEVATYRRVLKKYGKGKIQPSAFAGNAFTAIMNLKALIDSLGAQAVTAESITAALRASNDTSSFMTDNYTCDQHLSFSPITCVVGRRVFRVGKGKLVTISDKWYDGTSEAKLS
jgi:branched-chain amino acid transport system substrate-binding protein